MRKAILSIATAGSAAVLIAGCGTASVSSGGQSSSSPTRAAAPAPSSSSPSNSGGIGTTFKINDSDNNAVYTVTAVKVLDPATPDNSFDAAPSGKHLVGVEFVIKGISGSDQDDADNNSAIQGSNGQIYDSNIGGIAAGTDFNSGQFNTSPGSSETGWVNFEVPDGVTVTNVQWSPDSGISGSTATWTTGG